MNIRKRIIRFFYYWLGEDHGGNSAPPGSTQWLRFGEIDPDDGKPPYVATTGNNDGFELWLGTMHTWHVFYSAPEARRLAWFILWSWWVKGTWCGLKRWIWYKLLHIEVSDMIQRSTPVEGRSLVGGELEEATEDIDTPLDIVIQRDIERDIEAGEILEYKISGRRMRACTDQPVKAGQDLIWRPVIDYKPNERKNANAS